MPYSFNPFTGNFDNTPSTLKGDVAYSNLVSNSATWVDAYETGTVYKANSATYATIDFANSKFFPLTGGLITGNTRINGNVTIFGDLTSTGTQTFANTVFTTTSSLSIVHYGQGPALYVGQDGSGDIASFYDIDQGVEVLHIGGINAINPNVGVKTSTPNKDFTVNGEISSNNIIWDANGNSDQWNSTYNTVQTNSATTWNYQGTDLKDLSAGWVGGNDAFTNLVANSAAYLSAVDLSFLSVSANWNSVYNTVQTNSASNWDNEEARAYSRSNFLPLSGGVVTGTTTLSGTTQIGSGETVTLYIASSSVGINTEAPNESLTVVGNISATGLFYGDGSNLTGIVAGDTVATTLVRTNSGNWDSVYSTVQANSAANWNYQGADLKSLSADWQGTYTNYSANSASYASQNYVGSNFYPLSGGTLNGSITATDGSFDNVYVFQQDAGPAVLYAFDYKVGINTESPNESLTVVGNVSATNTIYANYLELSSVKFTNESVSNVSSVTASNDFLKVVVGNSTKYLRLYNVE